MAAAAKRIVIADGISDCSIVIPSKAYDSEKHAAGELQIYFEKMSGARVAVVSEDKAPAGCAILVGNTKQGSTIVTDEEAASLGEEGFVLRARGDKFVIRGGGQRGTLYGVYGLLENHLGIRWLAKDTTIIPRRQTIDLTSVEDRQRPMMEYREPYFFEAFDADWAAHNRVNGKSFHLEERHGHGTTYLGNYVHTFDQLVPPWKYFGDHPEYFSLVEGKRISYGQPCLSNPDVLKIVKGEVLRLAAESNGRPAIISVSQNDNFDACTCEKCLAMDNKEGSPAGTLLNFVNQVADEVAEEYSNILIDTLAYNYTEKAPLTIKPRPNMVIRLCHMAPSCDIHSLKRCDHNANFVKNLKDWSRLTDRLYAWHYSTNFYHYPGMLPNLNAMKEDIPFYYQHNVKGIFAQGSYESNGGDMAELKAWLIAKMLWDPGADFEALLKDFIDGYYGPAAPAMTEYISLQRRHVLSGQQHANLYSSPDAGYLDAELLEKLGETLRRAGKLAAGNELASEHVRKAKLWHDYTRLAAPTLFTVDGKPATYGERLARYEHFLEE
ncbi:MAG: DUF4838 domain-containing protein, partial [Thermodesulfobacteriota bacterium]